MSQEVQGTITTGAVASINRIDAPGRPVTTAASHRTSGPATFPPSSVFATPCQALGQPAALLIMLAALSAMIGGWFGTLGAAADRRSSRIGHAVLMVMGLVGVIAATRLLESMTIR